MTKLYFLIGIFLLGILCPPLIAASYNHPVSEEDGAFFWGEFKTPEGLKFTIREVEIGEWAQNASGEQTSAIAITYDLANETENRKIDLTKEPDFTLTDEFNNHYEKVEKPLAYTKPIMIKNKHFPSLYPQENFGSTVFFEAPVKTSQVLNLIINAQDLGLDDLMSFHLPVVRALPLVARPVDLPSDNDLQIVIPKNLRVVTPGEDIPVTVQFTKTRPDRIGDGNERARLVRKSHLEASCHRRGSSAHD